MRPETQHISEGIHALKNSNKFFALDQRVCLLNSERDELFWFVFHYNRSGQAGQPKGNTAVMALVLGLLVLLTALMIALLIYGSKGASIITSSQSVLMFR